MTGFISFPSWISPTVIPGLPVRWYGMMYLAAFGITFVLFHHEMRRGERITDRDQIADFFFWTILGLLLGGRLLYVLASDSSREYLSRPWMIVWPFKDGRFTGIQGMAYYGGLAGAVVAAVTYARVRKLDILEWGDALAVSAPLGYTFGRLGNFINGELNGRVTGVPWGVLFPTARRYPAVEEWVPGFAQAAGIPIYDPAQLVNLPRHPSQLYEALLEGVVLWLILWFVFRKRRPFKGALMALYIIGYGVARFMAGYFRETSEAKGFVISLGDWSTTPALVSHGLELTEGQVISLGMIAAGIAILVAFRLLHKPPPTVETFD
ncbi:MAG: prolipoprotein diacylglyceryl transferase [Spirochaetia bacterium]